MGRRQRWSLAGTPQRRTAREAGWVLVGNCTAKLRDGSRAFCKGCPPVPSQIARTIDAGKTLDD